MSEEEAKTKWCPMSRTSRLKEYHGQGEQYITDNELSEGNNCIASDCMMWRIRTWYNEERGAQIKGGFCGLAGTP